ncbi:MAG: AarF/UbiB family protein, partial [Rhodocyclaceae bacterium]
CTPRITAMERVFGGKVSAVDLPAPARRELADTLICALLGQPFWNPSEDALFHADLHAGNLLRADDGRLAIIDWSLAASLTKTQREALLAIAVGGLTLDAPAIRAALAGLCALRADDPALAAAVEDSLDRLVFHAHLPGFDWLMELLDDVARQTAARFAEDLLLFRKTWLALSGVLGDLVDRASPDLPLLRLGVQRFVAEWPARCLTSPDSRAFSTHLSNAELLRLCASPWPTAIRYGLRCWTRPLPRVSQ